MFKYHVNALAALRPSWSEQASRPEAKFPALQNAPITSAEIKARAVELGFDKTGIVAADSLSAESQNLRKWLDQNLHGKMGYMARDPEKRTDPRALFHLRNQLSLSRSTTIHLKSIQLNLATAKISRYAWGDDYHDVLREKLKALLAWIQERDPGAEGKICVDSSPTMDKAWAVRAGLGWIGKHTNLITKELGSWVFLGELLLSIDLEYDGFIEPDHCGTCTACLEACPTDAFIATVPDRCHTLHLVRDDRAAR